MPTEEIPQHKQRRERICILGSTGSIGVQTLQVVAEHSDRYEVYALTAGSNIALLAEQARATNAACVVVADSSRYDDLKALLADRTDIAVYAGSDAIAQVAAADSVDTVVAAIVGFAGLMPVMAAATAGKKICLANKEALVVAGSLLVATVREHGGALLPIDSEHSALWQCLAGEEPTTVAQLLLTASGGPFRTYTTEQLRDAPATAALRHPTWNMGSKITIDCATLMNKGFEVIEAHWLFGLPATQIEVVVHPQSIVHSAVLFCDGSIKAQLAPPDMRLPIAYALAYPHRLPTSLPRLTLPQQHLSFAAVDSDRFPCLRLAYDALRQGGTAPCVLSAANEVANDAYRHDRCRYFDIPRIIAATLRRAPHVALPTLADLVATDSAARRIAQGLLPSHL